MNFVPVRFVDSVILFNWNGERAQPSKLSSVWGERGTFLSEKRVDVTLNFSDTNTGAFQFSFETENERRVDTNEVFALPDQFFISKVCFMGRYGTKDGRKLTGEDTERIKHILKNSTVPVDNMECWTSDDSVDSNDFVWELIPAIPCIRKIECSSSLPEKMRDRTAEFVRLVLARVEQLRCRCTEDDLQAFTEAIMVNWLSSDSQKDVIFQLESECNYKALMKATASENFRNFTWSRKQFKLGDINDDDCKVRDVYILQTVGGEKRMLVNCVLDNEFSVFTYRVVRDCENYDEALEYVFAMFDGIE